MAAALKSHTEFLVGASSGLGVDRHLMGLRIVAAAAGLPTTPPIFSDPAYARSTNFALSTSNMNTPGYGPEFFDHCGFGAPTTDSYGVCYAIQDEALCLTITSNAACPGRSAERFARVLEGCLVDMVALAEAEAAAGPRSKL